MDNLEKTEESTNAFELASFETAVSYDVLPAVRWSQQKHEVAQMLAISGLKKTDISRQTKVPVATINNWLKSGEFNDYINKFALESVNILKSKRIQLYTKMIDAKIRKVEEDGGDYSMLSRKDILDVMKELREEVEESEKKSESNYTKLLEKMLLNSTPATIIEVKPGFDSAQPPMDSAQPPMDSAQPPMDSAQPPSAIVP